MGFRVHPRWPAGALIVSVAIASACGVDRADTTRASVVVELPFERLTGAGAAGQAGRDEMGNFRLDLVGVYVAASASAPGMQTVVSDWPAQAPDPLPETVELTMIVEAGQDRSFEVIALVVGDDSEILAWSAERDGIDLPGGQDYALDITLAPLAMLEVHETITLEADPGSIVAIHPVDDKLGIVYPAASWEQSVGAVVVTAEALPTARTVGWMALLQGGAWEQAPERTEVP